MQQYEVKYAKKPKRQKETKAMTELAYNMYQSARLKRPTLTRWYIDQLAELLVQKEQTNANA